VQAYAIAHQRKANAKLRDEIHNQAAHYFFFLRLFSYISPHDITKFIPVILYQ
jgi:hypothetical protein